MQKHKTPQDPRQTTTSNKETSDSISILSKPLLFHLSNHKISRLAARRASSDYN